MAFISANFAVGVSCSSIFVFKGIVYDVVHTRLESKSCGMEVYGVEKSNVSMEVAL